MAESQRRKLSELEREILDLKSEMDRLSCEAHAFIGKRDSMHEKMRELRLEAAKIRDERNALNDEVKNLKVILSELKQSYYEKLNSLNNLKQRIREHMKAKPARDKESLEGEISEIEWKIQTSSLPLEEENKLVKRVKLLESQLAFYSNLEAMKNEIATLREQIGKLKDEIASYGNSIAEKAEKSRKLHEKMIEYFREIDRLRIEADGMHRMHLECREKLSSLRLKYVDMLGQISAIKKIIREEEEKRKAEAAATLKEKIEKEALEKLKRGGKISFEEFKILAEQGKI